MPTYHYTIRKADHIKNDGRGGDLHVHVDYYEGKRKVSLGRYRIPTLEPVFPRKEPELNEAEKRALSEWMARPEQVKKLNNCLKDTVFDLGKVAAQVPEFGDIVVDEGETFIQIRIPVSRRLQ